MKNSSLHKSHLVSVSVQQQKQTKRKSQVHLCSSSFAQSHSGAEAKIDQDRPLLSPRCNVFVESCLECSSVYTTLSLLFRKIRPTRKNNNKANLVQASHQTQICFWNVVFQESNYSYCPIKHKRIVFRFIYFMFMSVLAAWTYVHHVCIYVQCPQSSEEGIRSPWNLC